MGFPPSVIREGEPIVLVIGCISFPTELPVSHLSTYEVEVGGKRLENNILLLANREDHKGIGMERSIERIPIKWPTNGPLGELLIKEL